MLEKPRRSSRGLRTFLFLVTLGLCVAGTAWLLLREPPVPVRVCVVARGFVEQTVTPTAAATLKPEREVKLYPELVGKVRTIHHREGARIEAGVLLLELESRSLQAELEVTEAQLRLAESRREQEKLESARAEREYRRALAQFQPGNGVPEPTISEREFQRIESDWRLAQQAIVTAEKSIEQWKAQRKLAETNLAKTRITAPFGGTIAKLAVEEGGDVSPGTLLFEIIDTSSLHVRASIDEVDLGKVALGQEVRLVFDTYPDHPIAGRVYEISPVVSTTHEQNRTGDIKISLEKIPPGLRVGMSSDAVIVTKRKPDALYIPSKTIRDFEYVYVVEKGILRKRKIVKGLDNWETTEVAEGLALGERVVSLLDLEEAGELDGRPAVIESELP